MIVTESKPQNDLKVTPAFQRILVAIDFSEASRRALCGVLPLAIDQHAQISAVHVLNSDWRYETLENPPEIDMERIDAQTKLKEWVSGLGLGPEQEIGQILVKHGPVAQAILAIADEQKPDLLVIGTHGRGGLSKLALGSMAEEVLRLATIPVMTIGPKADIATTHHGPGFHTILFATDYGEGSTKALPIVLSVAKEYDSKLILLHMISPMPSTTNLSAYAPASAAADEVGEWEVSSRKRSLQQLRDWFPRDTGLSKDPELVVGTDFLPEGILAASSKFNVDLIVMGASQRGSARVAAHVPWSSVHEVVRCAPCPVLTAAG